MPPEKKRKYNSDQENLPEFKGWLKKSPTFEGKAFCKLCQTDLRLHRNDLVVHSMGLKHKKAIEASKQQPSTSKIFPLSTHILSESSKINQRELHLALFIATKTSIGNVDPLGEIIQQEFGPHSIQLHHTKCEAMIRKILGPYFKDELQKDLQGAYFSLLVDE